MQATLANWAAAPPSSRLLSLQSLPPQASQCQRARHNLTAAAIAADATGAHTQRLCGLIEGHPMAQPPADEDPRVFVRSGLGSTPTACDACSNP